MSSSLDTMRLFTLLESAGQIFWHLYEGLVVYYIPVLEKHSTPLSREPFVIYSGC